MPALPIPTAKNNDAFLKIKRGSIEMSKISSPSHISGHKVIENFITEEEETELLRAVYDMSEQTWNDRNASGNGTAQREVLGGERGQGAEESVQSEEGNAGGVSEDCFGKVTRE